MWAVCLFSVMGKQQGTGGGDGEGLGGGDGVAGGDSCLGASLFGLSKVGHGFAWQCTNTNYFYAYRIRSFINAMCYYMGKKKNRKQGKGMEGPDRLYL